MKIWLLIFIIPVVLIPVFFEIPQKVFASHSRVDLLSADNFAVLAGSAISSVPTSTIIGDVGLSPTGGASITGLTCAEVTGTIYDNDAGYAGGGGCLVTNAGLLTLAKTDLTTAYTDAAARSTTSTIPTDLAGATLTDGTYDSASGTFGITGGGTLTLDGEGNADAVFIFKMGTTLITSSSSSVVLINGAQACNVYWQVGSSATLGTSSTLLGNVLALTSITDSGSSTVNGRLLARNGAVTLNNTTVTKQTCTVTPTPTPTPTPSSSTSSSTSTTTSSSAGTGGPTSCPEITTVPSIIESRRIDADSIFISWGPFAGIDTFNVRYGQTNGDWSYNTNVTGFSTTLDALPTNQSIWIQVAARNDCAIGSYGAAVLAGGVTRTGTPGFPNTGNPRIPRLPNTGIAPDDKNIPWHIALPAIILALVSTACIVALKKRTI